MDNTKYYCPITMLECNLGMIIKKDNHGEEEALKCRLWDKEYRMCGLSNSKYYEIDGFRIAK